MFDKTGTWIEFPEIEAPSIVASLSNSSFKVEVVSSGIFMTLLTCFLFVDNTQDIIDEPTLCIVNAANEHLDHCGGIALTIAEKCGKKMIDECKGT